MKRLFQIMLILLTLSAAYGQVKVLPPACFLDPLSKSGIIVLQNGTNEGKEVTLEFDHGYVKHNERGFPSIYKGDEGDRGYSLQPYIRAFPRKVMIPPFGNQTVRFIVRTPPRMKDGTYWVRLITKSSVPGEQIDTISKGKVGVYYKLVPATNTIIIFRKGKCNQDLKILSHKFEVTRENVVFNMSFDRGEGNSPFWGTILIDIFDDSGNKVDSKEELMIVYFQDDMLFKFDKTKFKPGKYKAEIKITGERETISKANLLDFDDMGETYYFTVP